MRNLQRYDIYRLFQTLQTDTSVSRLQPCPHAEPPSCPCRASRTLDTGRHGLPLLLSAAPVALSPLDQLTGNYVFAVGFCGWFLAQFLKIFTKWYKTGVFTLRAFVDSGGMPSSHSALCSVRLIIHSYAMPKGALSRCPCTFHVSQDAL